MRSLKRTKYQRFHTKPAASDLAATEIKYGKKGEHLCHEFEQCRIIWTLSHITQVFFFALSHSISMNCICCNQCYMTVAFWSIHPCSDYHHHIAGLCGNHTTTPFAVVDFFLQRYIKLIHFAGANGNHIFALRIDSVQFSWVQCRFSYSDRVIRTICR